MKILVVEDEAALNDALTEILKRNQYNVDSVDNGEDGLEYGLTGLYDCIILDIMLPVMDGITVLKQLRKSKISTPVMLLTAKSDIDDKITGLDCGADAALLRTGLQNRGIRLAGYLFSTLADQLIDRRH